jgi:hypothetical protein
VALKSPLSCRSSLQRDLIRPDRSTCVRHICGGYFTIRSVYLRAVMYRGKDYNQDDRLATDGSRTDALKYIGTSAGRLMCRCRERQNLAETVA